MLFVEIENKHPVGWKISNPLKYVNHKQNHHFHIHGRGFIPTYNNFVEKQPSGYLIVTFVSYPKIPSHRFENRHRNQKHKYTKPENTKPDRFSIRRIHAEYNIIIILFSLFVCLCVVFAWLLSKCVPRL